MHVGRGKADCNFTMLILCSESLFIKPLFYGPYGN